MKTLNITNLDALVVDPILSIYEATLDYKFKFKEGFVILEKEIINNYEKDCHCIGHYYKVIRSTFHRVISDRKIFLYSEMEQGSPSDQILQLHEDFLSI
jgi:hypothetical protein